MGLRDLHTHLLPEIDDGYMNTELYIRMVEIYRECGIEEVVTTPHIYNPYVTTHVDRIRSTFEWAQEEAQKRGLALHLGSELYVSDQEHLQAIPIRNRFVLVEFSLALPPVKVTQRLKTLIDEGFTPIIAHVERYMWLKPTAPLLTEFRAMGCLIQVNVDAVESGDALPYLEAELVDIIATDNHGDERLPLKLVQVLETWPSVRKRMSEIW